MIILSHFISGRVALLVTVAEVVGWISRVVGWRRVRLLVGGVRGREPVSSVHVGYVIVNEVGVRGIVAPVGVDG